jgi:hypothetical protein
MVDINKLRSGIGGLKVNNETEWGSAKATERYGKLSSPNMKPADASPPQFKNDKPAPGYSNDVADGWLRGSGPKFAEGKPGFDHGYRGKRR